MGYRGMKVDCVVFDEEIKTGVPQGVMLYFQYLWDNPSEALKRTRNREEYDLLMGRGRLVKTLEAVLDKRAMEDGYTWQWFSVGMVR